MRFYEIYLIFEIFWLKAKKYNIRVKIYKKTIDKSK